MNGLTRALKWLPHQNFVLRAFQFTHHLAALNVPVDQRTAAEIRHEWDREMRLICIRMMPGVSLILLVWNIVDYSLKSQHFLFASFTRSASAILTAALWLIVLRSKDKPWRARMSAFISIASIQAGSLAILATNDSATYSAQIFGLMLVIFGSAVSLPWNWRYPAILAAFTLLGYVAVLWYHPKPVDMIIFTVIFVGGTSILSLTALFFQNRESIRSFIIKRQAQQALNVAQEAREYNQQLMIDLQRLTLEDPLTTIANRRAFQEFLDRLLEQADPETDTIGVVMLDIDHFKKLNDTFGHQIGDEVLREVSRRLSNTIRNQDLVARYGGEEFVVVLPNVSLTELAAMAEKLRTSMRSPTAESPLFNYLDEDEINGISLSAGSGLYPQVGTTAPQLIKAADEALYYAKNHGRDQSHVTTAVAASTATMLTHISTIQPPIDDTAVTHPEDPQHHQKPTLTAYYEEITPSFKIFAQGAAALAFLLIGSWIMTEYFFRQKLFHHVYYLRLMAELYMIPDFLWMRHPKTRYTSMAAISLGAMVAIQISFALPLPQVGAAFNESLLVLTMVIFAGGICLPWHWKYSLYLIGCTVASVFIGHLFVYPGLDGRSIFRVLFFVLCASVFAVVGHYARFNTGWSKFVARQTLIQARAAAEKQHRENNKIVNQLAELTRLDALTQVANRRAFDEHLDVLLATADTDTTHFALIMLDIDHFKVLNDTFGHQSGDRVLCEVAQALQDRLPSDGFIARYGGEEFVVIAPNIDSSQLHTFTEAIRNNITDDLILTRSGSELAGYRLTLSAGAAMWPAHALSADELVKVADSHLYAAKSAGRDRTVSATVPQLPTQPAATGPRLHRLAPSRES